MNEKKTGLTPLKEIIDSLLCGSGLSINPEDALIWRVWDETIGLGIAENARPLWIRKGRLRVEVSDPIWLQELGMDERNIRDRLNRRLGREAVEKIEFRLRSR